MLPAAARRARLGRCLWCARESHLRGTATLGDRSPSTQRSSRARISAGLTEPPVPLCSPPSGRDRPAAYRPPSNNGRGAVWRARSHHRSRRSRGAVGKGHQFAHPSVTDTTSRRRDARPHFLPMPIVTSTYRYKRLFRKRKPVGIKGPRIVTSVDPKEAAARRCTAGRRLRRGMKSPAFRRARASQARNAAAGQRHRPSPLGHMPDEASRRETTLTGQWISRVRASGRRANSCFRGA